jgi:hypothetical protein
MSGGSLDTVIEHAVEAITSAETSSFKEENELFRLCANVKINGGRRAVETSGTSVLVKNIVEDKVESLGVSNGQDKK